MNVRTYIACLLGGASLASAAGLMQTQIVDHAVGLDATVIVIQPEQNRGFSVIDVPWKIDGDNILRHWSPQYDLMINGGYFNADFTPTGLCKVNGRFISSNVSSRLSGFVAIDAKGAVSLLTQHDDISPYPTVLQAGPYVIDPGGAVGIRATNAVPAERTLIGMTRKHELLIIATKSITLRNLAVAMKKAVPDIERLLNLDGGPSTALKTLASEKLNISPVRNYIARRK